MVILLIYCQPDTLAQQISRHFSETDLRVWTPGMSPTEWQQGLEEFRGASERDNTTLIVVAPPTMLEQQTEEGLVGFRHTLPRSTQDQIGVMTHQVESLDGGLEFVATALTQSNELLHSLSQFVRQPDLKMLQTLKRFL